MKKIICIGECCLNIVLDDKGQTTGTFAGGQIANAAAILASKGLNTIMASEAAADSIGNIALQHLIDAGVDISSVDRYTEGRTPLNIFTAAPAVSSEPSSLTRYEQYPDEAFDIVWPRIDPGDIVLFGGYYALDSRMRPRLLRLLSHAAERNALLIYLPGFMPGQVTRMTRVMPQIFENLEMASLVITRSRDLELIFGVDEPETCYHNHVDFYCRSLINIDSACNCISYYAGSEMNRMELHSSGGSPLLNAGVIAGIVASLFEKDVTPEVLDTPGEELRRNVLTAAAMTAKEVDKSSPFSHISNYF